MKKNRSKLPDIYLGLILTVMYIPIIIVIIYSFNASKLTSVWEGFSLVWYRELFADQSMFEALWNSIVLATLSCLSAALIGTLGAVALFRAKLKGAGAVEYISTLPIMIPEIILGMVFLSFFSLLGMPLGMTTLVIAHTTFCVPYIFMMVRARLVGIDASYVEAAKDLGAGELQAFRDITLPLIRPAILSGALLAFAMSFDDVVISMFVTGPTTNTLPLKVYTQLKTGVTPKINALCTLMLGVALIMVLLSSLIGRSHKDI